MWTLTCTVNRVIDLFFIKTRNISGIPTCWRVFLFIKMSIYFFPRRERPTFLELPFIHTDSVHMYQLQCPVDTHTQISKKKSLTKLSIFHCQDSASLSKFFVRFARFPPKILKSITAWGGQHKKTKTKTKTSRSAIGLKHQKNIPNSFAYARTYT